MKNNIIKKIFILIIVIIFLIVFSSSYSSLSINNLAYVLAIGIDSADNGNLEVTFQFSSPVSVSESGSSSSEKASVLTNSVTTSSISNAINLMNGYLVKKINMSHCKVIVFSEELAYKGIQNEIYTLINDTQVRPSCNVIISKCDAKSYIKQTKPQLENLVSNYYELLTQSCKYTGLVPDSTIGDFFNDLNCNSCSPYAILGGLNASSVTNKNNSDIKSNETPIVGKNGTENFGIAVFNDGKLVGELNSTETIIFMALKKDVNRFLITIPDPINTGESLDIYLSPYDTPKIDIDTSTPSPYIKIQTKFAGRIYSMSENSNYLNTETLDEISKSCNKYLETEIYKLLYKTSKEFKSDIHGFGKNALANFLYTKDFKNYNWLASYSNSFFDVKADTSIKSGMLITET